MRRRTWALVRMCDVMFSHQVSLPNMIYEHDCDTQLPHNIFDDEFGPDTKVLPPSRPLSEPTPISYMIAKVKLCMELGNILQATTRVGRVVHYDEILKFDDKLRELRAELPPHLKVQPLDGCHDPLSLIIARFNIDILAQKIMCILHRKYLSRARQNPRYAYSRRAAVESSLETLRHLQVLHRESQSSGRLRSIKWYVTSIATKDFILPAMLVALDLHLDGAAERSGERQDSQAMFFWTPEQRIEMVRTLEVTKDIWEGLADGSVEAFKAYNMLRIVLDKIRAPSPGRDATTSGSAPTKSDLFSASPALQPEHSAAMTLGMLSGGMTPNTAALFNSVQSPGGTSYPTIDPALTGDGVPTDFAQEMIPNFDNPGSPFALFNGLSDTMDFTTNFDWVRYTRAGGTNESADVQPAGVIPELRTKWQFRR
jgi:hypothetical protein